MDPHITYWVIMSAQVTKDFGLSTYSFECNVLAFELFVVLFRRMTGGFYSNRKRGRVILKLPSPINFVFTTSELEPASVSSSTFLF